MDVTDEHGIAVHHASAGPQLTYHEQGRFPVDLDDAGAQAEAWDIDAVHRPGLGGGRFRWRLGAADLTPHAVRDAQPGGIEDFIRRDHVHVDLQHVAGGRSIDSEAQRVVDALTRQPAIDGQRHDALDPIAVEPGQGQMEAHGFAGRLGRVINDHAQHRRRARLRRVEELKCNVAQVEVGRRQRCCWANIRCESGCRFQHRIAIG